MNAKYTTLHRILTFLLGMAMIIGSIAWIQTTTDSVSAQEPVVDLTVYVVPTDGGFNLATIEPDPIFNVGEQFNVSIVVQGVNDPGIFGNQFELHYDPTYLQAIEGELISGQAMEPVVVAVDDINLDDGVVNWAASRSGDVENVSGDIVLATLTFEAIAATEPPEGQSTAITINDVRLGAKGGISVPVGGLVNTEVIIRNGDTDQGDITGKVTVEGRGVDQQDGHTITAVGSSDTLVETTAPDGTFFFNDVPADTYTLTANSSGFLAATCADVVHTIDALTTLDDATLLAGDIDDSGEIDITDAVTIASVFSSITPGEVADLNLDGEVDILDLILMTANYGQTSTNNPWACQLATEL